MDIMNNVENVKTQMRRGVLEYCILSILSKKDSYASSILSELKDARMIVVEGTIYPLLIRQKKPGLLTYRWEESPQGPPRKYYRYQTKAGLAGRRWVPAWQEIVETTVF